VPKATARETITAQRAAELLNVSVMTVHRLCDAGELVAHRVTSAPRSQRLIALASVLAFAKKVQGRDIK